MVKDHHWGQRGNRAEPPTAEDATGWIAGLIPDGWFTERPAITIDRDEIVIVGTLAAPVHTSDATDADRASAERGRIAGFREDTREQRIRYARQIEHRYERKVAWGIACGGTTQIFTSLSAPVMTRLRQPDRQILDTLVDAGVARSRSDALAWCVRLVGEHADDWLGQLRSAMAAVDDLRRQGPDVG